MGIKGGYPLTSVSRKQRVYSGRFAGINGAAPTSYVLDDGITVARSGEGVWVITLPQPLAGYKAVVTQAIDNDGKYHDCHHVLNAAARTITVTHRNVALSSGLSPLTVKGRLPDVSAADAATSNRAYATSPVAGTITKIQAQIVSGGPLNAAAIVTNNINGTPITTGAITLPDTSAVGTVVAVTPSAANTVAVGDILTGVTDAGGSTSAAVDLTYTIQPTGPAAEDVVDEISFVAFVELSDIPGSGV